MSTRPGPPALADLAQRVPEGEDTGDTPSVIESWREGLARYAAAIAGHDSGDQTPLSARLRAQATKRTPQEQ